MKLSRILIGWVGMLVSAGMVSAAEVNLLANGGFEGMEPSWSSNLSPRRSSA